MIMDFLDDLIFLIKNSFISFHCHALKRRHSLSSDGWFLASIIFLDSSSFSVLKLVFSSSNCWFFHSKITFSCHTSISLLSAHAKFSSASFSLFSNSSYISLFHLAIACFRFSSKTAILYSAFSFSFDKISIVFCKLSIFSLFLFIFNSRSLMLFSASESLSSKMEAFSSRILICLSLSFMAFWYSSLLAHDSDNSWIFSSKILIFSFASVISLNSLGDFFNNISNKNTKWSFVSSFGQCNIFWFTLIDSILYHFLIHFFK